MIIAGLLVDVLAGIAAVGAVGALFAAAWALLDVRRATRDLQRLLDELGGDPPPRRHG